LPLLLYLLRPFLRTVFGSLSSPVLIRRIVRLLVLTMTTVVVVAVFGPSLAALLPRRLFACSRSLAPLDRAEENCDVAQKKSSRFSWGLVVLLRRVDYFFGVRVTVVVSTKTTFLCVKNVLCVKSRNSRRKRRFGKASTPKKDLSGRREARSKAATIESITNQSHRQRSESNDEDRHGHGRRGGGGGGGGGPDTLDSDLLFNHGEPSGVVARRRGGGGGPDTLDSDHGEPSGVVARRGGGGSGVDALALALDTEDTDLPSVRNIVPGVKWNVTDEKVIEVRLQLGERRNLL